MLSNKALIALKRGYRGRAPLLKEMAISLRRRSKNERYNLLLFQTLGIFASSNFLYYVGLFSLGLCFRYFFNKTLLVEFLSLSSLIAAPKIISNQKPKASLKCLKQVSTA